MPLLLLLLVLTADAVDCISADLESAELTLVLVVLLLLVPNRNGLLGSVENPTALLLSLLEVDPKPENEENKPVPEDAWKYNGKESLLLICSSFNFFAVHFNFQK